MSLYILYAKDKPDNLESRLEHYAAHRAFVEAQSEIGHITVIMSGPLQSDDGGVMVGSMLLIDAPTREDVDQFVAQDPFMRAGVWGEVDITRFYLRHSSPRSLAQHINK